MEILETRVDRKFEDVTKLLATKEDLSGKFNDLLKWMIIMWITQLGAIAAILKLMLH